MTRSDDRGFSLMELMVNMAVMSVVVTLFTTGMVQLFSAQNHSDALTGASSQVHTAFIRLDRDLRYSSGISLPGTSAGTGCDPALSTACYVEYAITNTGSTICTQLRLTTAGQLQTRRKIDTALASGWSTIASELVGPSSFTRNDASDSGNAYQQLLASLTARSGGAAARESETSTFTFTALNTSTTTSSDTVCNSLDRP